MASSPAGAPVPVESVWARVPEHPCKPPERTPRCADVFHRLPVGLAVWRLEDPRDLGSFRLLNAHPAAAQMSCEPARDRMGTRLADGFAAAMDARMRAQLADVIGSGVERDLGDVPCGAGVFAVKAFPFADRCVGAVFEDVTERRLEQEQLRCGQRMEALGRLAAGIAHDFNNIVAAIMGYGELALAMTGAGSLRAHLQEIFAAAKKAAALNRQLMGFSRRPVLRPRVLDLRIVVTGVKRMLRRLIGEGISLVTDLPPELGRVRCDPGQIEQVAVNLAVNARDAMSGGGTLTFRLDDVQRTEAEVWSHEGASAGPYVLLEVSDTGEGMDRETLSQAFEPFFTTKAPGRGTGLGLATVYEIVRQSGGHIEVESARGQGTTLRIYLPRVEDEPDLDGPPASVHVPRGTETILVVEDEAAVRGVLRQGLEACGYTVLEAGQPEDAVRLAAEHHSDVSLLISDVVMPRMTGPELWSCLASRWRGLKVVFVSGYPDEVTADLLMGGAPVLQKPFVRADLARTVREALDGHELVS